MSSPSGDAAPRFLPQFQALVADDARIDLAAAALAYAREEYPSLDPGTYLGRLDALADEARGWFPAEGEPREVIDGLAAFLAGEKGFRGNDSEYDDPRNSFLNEVLDRGIGLPITVTAVWTEVARRLGLPIVGVGMPGHFIAKWADRDEEVLLDPFAGGKVITREECLVRLRGMYGDAAELTDDHFTAWRPRDTLARMLRNLKGVYARGGAHPRALWVVEYLLVLFPDSPEDLRDRGAIRFHAGDWVGAEEDLARAATLWPEGEEGRDVVEGLAEQVRRMRRRMN